MINGQAQRESFVVRIWRENGQSEWKGWVQHVCSGDAIPLRNLQDLVSYLERWTTQPTMENRRGLR
jgi:hypothetical protein